MTDNVLEFPTSKTDDPNVVTVGREGKVARFVQRGKFGDEGYVRMTVDGTRVTISGYVPAYGHGGKVFYPWTANKNAKLAA